MKAQVKSILEKNVNARNQDSFLIEKVCAIFGHNPIEKASSIERCRRFWQAQGLYLPSDEQVAKQHKMNMDEWRVSMGYPTKQTAGTEHPSWTPPSEVKHPSIVPPREEEHKVEQTTLNL